MHRSRRLRQPGLSWRALIFSDLQRYVPDQEPSAVLLLKTTLTTPGVLASSILRAQQTLNSRGWHRPAAALRHVALALSQLDFVPGAEIGPGLLMHHPHGIVIGHGVVVGSGCTLLHNVTLGERFADGRPPHDYPVVGDDVTIGAGACVLGAVVVGDGAHIGANSVVLCDVPAGAVAVGSPARVHKSENGAGANEQNLGH